MNPNRTSNITFTPDQLKYIEDLFRQVVLPPTTSHEAMSYYFGSQAVVEAIRNKTRGLNVRDIPAPR